MSIMAKRKRNDSGVEVEESEWPECDLKQLVQNIEEQIPDDDKLSFHKRMEKLDWNKIIFNQYSVKQCQEAWSMLHKHVRKFRFLKEITYDVKQWIVDPPKKKSVDKKNPLNHPDKPKQSYGSYIFFYQQKHSEFKKQYPDLKRSEITKLLGEAFNRLPLEEREYYEGLAKSARSKYLEDLNEFYVKHPELAKPSGKSEKGYQFKEGTGPPAKPRTPFELFHQSEKEKQTEKGGIYLKCKNMWNEMPDDEKIFWINYSCEELKKYREDIKEYLKKHPQYEPENITTTLTKAEQNLKEKLSGKPERPPRTAYLLYVKSVSQSEGINHLTGKELLSHLSDRWRSCSEEEKNEYRLRISQLWEEYYIKLEEYAKSLSVEERQRLLHNETTNKKSTTIQNKQKRLKNNIIQNTLQKPKTPPTTVFKYFLSVYSGNENPKTVWRKLSEAERAVYLEGFELSKQNYINLYEQYLSSLSKEELIKMRISLNNDDLTETSSFCSSCSECNTDIVG